MEDIFRSCGDIITGVPSECILLQADIADNIEDSLLQMNILKTEGNAGFGSDHPYFSTVSSFGDFIHLNDDLVNKFDINDEKISHDQFQEEVIVQEVAEQEIISDPSDSISRKHSYDLFQKILKPPSYSCNFCNRKFLKESNLRKHISTRHMKQPSYQCSKCNDSFLEKKTLISHLRMNCSKKGSSLICKENKRRSKIQMKFEREMISLQRLDDDYYQSTSCDERYDFEKDSCFHELDANMQLVEDPYQNETFSNEIFNEKYFDLSLKTLESNQDKLRICYKNNHAVSKMDVSSGINSVKHVCEVCSHDCKTSRELEMHLKEHKKYTKHFSKKPSSSRTAPADLDDFTCKYCEKKCKDLRGLQKHSSVHSGGQLLICTFCKKQFYTRTRLKRHMHSHRDKAVTCEECDETLPDNRALANHRASHNVVISRDGGLSSKMFPCHSCNKVFGSRSSQQIHMRVHTGERPYSCRFCIKAFADGGTLRKHERIHTGEKPYVCPICWKAFNQRVVLREHIKAYHAGTGSSRSECFKCQVCSEIFKSSPELCTHLVKHSDDNTAMHRVPLMKPRKYKKWKSKQVEKSISESVNECENGNSSCFDDAVKIHSIENSTKLSTEHNVLETSDVSSIENVRLSVSKPNDIVLPLRCKSSELANSDLKFSVEIDYRLMNNLVEKLPESCDTKDEDCDNASDSCLSLIEISDNKIIDNDTTIDYKGNKNEFWFALKGKYEYSIDSDLCVHSGLGLGATVELQSEFQS